jgi:hypothetical protein
MATVTACRKFFFLLISVFTLGAVLAILIAALVMGEKLQFFKTDPHLLPVVIAATAVAFLIFLFAAIVSCTQKRGCRIALAAIFVAFAILLLAAAILAIARQKDVVPALADLWHGTTQAQKDVVDALQRAFDCCGWNQTREGCKGGPCEPTISNDVKHYWKGAAGALLGFALVLLILGAIACKCACGEPKVEDHVSLDSLRYTDPIYPGIRPVDSKGTYKYTW